MAVIETTLFDLSITTRNTIHVLRSIETMCRVESYNPPNNVRFPDQGRNMNSGLAMVGGTQMGTGPQLPSVGYSFNRRDRERRPAQIPPSSLQ